MMVQFNIFFLDLSIMKKKHVYFNRPGVVRAVLQTHLSFTELFVLSFRIFNSLSIPKCKSWGAEILRECSPPTMRQMPRIMCQLSSVTYIYFFFFFLQSGGASRGRVFINGAYLVIFFILTFLIICSLIIIFPFTVPANINTDLCQQSQ